jgi:hypothetical protein
MTTQARPHHIALLEEVLVEMKKVIAMQRALELRWRIREVQRELERIARLADTLASSLVSPYRP